MAEGIYFSNVDIYNNIAYVSFNWTHLQCWYDPPIADHIVQYIYIDFEVYVSPTHSEVGDPEGDAGSSRSIIEYFADVPTFSWTTGSGSPVQGSSSCISRSVYVYVCLYLPLWFSTRHGHTHNGRLCSSWWPDESYLSASVAALNMSTFNSASLSCFLSLTEGCVTLQRDPVRGVLAELSLNTTGKWRKCWRRDGKGVKNIVMEICRACSVNEMKMDAEGEESQTCRPCSVGSLQLDFSTWPSFSLPSPSLLLCPQEHNLPPSLPPSSSSSCFISPLLSIIHDNLSVSPSHPGRDISSICWSPSSSSAFSSLARFIVSLIMLPRLSLPSFSLSPPPFSSPHYFLFSHILRQHLTASAGKPNAVRAAAGKTKRWPSWTACSAVCRGRGKDGGWERGGQGRQGNQGLPELWAPLWGPSILLGPIGCYQCIKMDIGNMEIV